MHESIYACVWLSALHGWGSISTIPNQSKLNFVGTEEPPEEQQTLPKSSAVLIEGKTNSVTLIWGNLCMHWMWEGITHASVLPCQGSHITSVHGMKRHYKALCHMEMVLATVANRQGEPLSTVTKHLEQSGEDHRVRSCFQVTARNVLNPLHAWDHCLSEEFINLISGT